MNEPYTIPKEVIDILIAELKDLKRICEKGIQNINKRIDEVKQRVKVLEAERVK
jgi:translation initiation factor 2B subunit (eIF-2B alpha/beta/delta family)